MTPGIGGRGVVHGETHMSSESKTITDIPIPSSGSSHDRADEPVASGPARPWRSREGLWPSPVPRIGQLPTPRAPFGSLVESALVGTELTANPGDQEDGQRLSACSLVERKDRRPGTCAR